MLHAHWFVSIQFLFFTIPGEAETYDCGSKYLLINSISNNVHVSHDCCRRQEMKLTSLAGWLKWLRCLLKPRAANHCPGDTSSIPARVNLFVWTCSLMVWLLPASQGGFTVHRACLEDGHMYWLSSTSTALATAASREKGLWVERCSSGE